MRLGVYIQPQELAGLRPDLHNDSVLTLQVENVKEAVAGVMCKYKKRSLLVLMTASASNNI
jgi:hypothetical protein